MDVAYLLTYLSIALLLWYLISEIFKAQTGKHRIAAIVFVGIVFSLLAWSIWSTYKDEKKKRKKYGHNIEMGNEETSEVSDSEESIIDEEDRVHIQKKYKVRNIPLSVVDGKIKKKKALKYKNFKKWYLGPDFLAKFTEATKIALKIQRVRISEYRKNIIKKIKKLRGGNSKKKGLEGLMQNLTNKNDELKMLEMGLDRCNKLDKIITKREKNVTIERTKKNLIKALTNPKKGLDSVIGQTDIKDLIALQLNTFSENPRIFLSNFQNTILKGPSGIGKTKLAEVIGYVYGTSGITLVRDVGKYTKTAITTAYVDESGKMTKRLFLSYLGAVIFFDEAYTIASPKNSFGPKHGSDAIAEMLEFMNDSKGLTIVIAAGYKKEMEERFEGDNQGIERRFPHKRVLDYYSSKELTMILMKFICITCPELNINEDLGNYIHTLVDYINKKDQEKIPKNRIFRTQAGAMENLSSRITSSIYGTRGKSWPKDSEYLVLSGFNTFLSPYNINLQQEQIL